MRLMALVPAVLNNNDYMMSPILTIGSILSIFNQYEHNRLSLVNSEESSNGGA